MKTRKSYWICKPCHKTMVKELDDLCAIELMLISQLIPFMFILAKANGAQHGLKGQCVMVPADLSKIQTILPKTCSDEYIISLALKGLLSDKSYVNKHSIQPNFVDQALRMLVESNLLYKDIRSQNQWQSISEQMQPGIWNGLTGNTKNETDNEIHFLWDSDDEVNNQKDKKLPSNPYTTLMYDKEGPNVSAEELINIAPGEGNIPVSFTSEPNWEALCFVKEYALGYNHFAEEREFPIKLSKYVHARLKCCNDRFTSNP